MTLPSPTLISDKMNPRITTITIGVRELKEMTLYPLSVKDQFEFTEVLTTAIAQFFSGRDADEESIPEESIVALIIDLIQDNLPKLLNYVLEIPEGVDVLSDMTNEQLTDICEVVYEVNYGVLGKKVNDLLEKIKEQFLSERSVATSLEDMEEELLSETSPETVLETEE